jgi:hypothetical protein
MIISFSLSYYHVFITAPEKAIKAVCLLHPPATPQPPVLTVAPYRSVI